MRDNAHLHRVHALHCELLHRRLHIIVPRIVVDPIIARPNTREVALLVRPLIPNTILNTIQPPTAIRDAVAELASSRDAERRHRLVDGLAPGVARPASVARHRRVRLVVEGDVRMPVELDTVGAFHEAFPLGEAHEAVVQADVRALALAGATSLTNDLVGLVVAK